MNDERCLSDSGMPPDQIYTVISFLQAEKEKEAAAILKAWRISFMSARNESTVWTTFYRITRRNCNERRKIDLE